jgi:molybdopterin converting factor small subunit
VSVLIEATGSLRQYIPENTRLEAAPTVGQAIAQLQLPPDVALMMLVNRKAADWTTELHDGDVLRLMPTIGGGARHAGRAANL